MGGEEGKVRNRKGKGIEESREKAQSIERVTAEELARRIAGSNRRKKEARDRSTEDE
jgi:hypothetical protein